VSAARSGSLVRCKVRTRYARVACFCSKVAQLYDLGVAYCLSMEQLRTGDATQEA
jgi:hypothetical protein